MTTRPVLVIGNKNYSSWSLRPWLLLRQHGVMFDEMRLPLDTPEFAGAYFYKIECFCFNDTTLKPGEQLDMPVVFYVDPAFAKDPDMAHVDTITLSYTFLRSTNPSQAKNLSRFLANAAPDPAHGEELFGERCTACHALDRNKTGPMLGGVVGREAGSAAGYHYSPALKNAGLVWSTDNLDHWLADPKKFVPGVRMPVRVLDAPSRRDIIAYLQKVGGAHASQAKAGAHASGGEY